MGVHEGGALWFADLTAPAIEGSLAAGYACPMGIAGCALPFLNAALYFYNVQESFRIPRPPAGGDAGGAAREQPVHMVLLRLLLEWVTFPILIASLHMPQSAVVHWIASGAYTGVVHNHLLRLPLRSDSESEANMGDHKMGNNELFRCTRSMTNFLRARRAP